ncbi:hypothetical protein DY000_02032885 [Brassica cretica]|uniref:Uncharacterized protein n=1 Tax=Brassica cretica TaxID=69181 RepID=A0ABQ7DV16_BRACR|nr:hypothetical protein DY000_02032885 [Brassica cretica]
MKSGKNGKTIKGLKISSSKQTNLTIKHGFSSAVRRAGSTADSAWPFADLDPRRIQLGGAGSTGIRLHLVLVTPLPRLHRTHSCFVSIGGIVGTLRLKNRGNSFARITFRLIV